MSSADEWGLEAGSLDILLQELMFFLLHHKGLLQGVGFLKKETWIDNYKTVFKILACLIIFSWRESHLRAFSVQPVRTQTASTSPPYPPKSIWVKVNFQWRREFHFYQKLIAFPALCNGVLPKVGLDVFWFLAWRLKPPHQSGSQRGNNSLVPTQWYKSCVQACRFKEWNKITTHPHLYL